MKLICTEGKLDPDMDLAVRQIMDAYAEAVVRINSLRSKGVEVHVQVKVLSDHQWLLVGVETQPLNSGVVIVGQTPYVATYRVEGAL